MDNHIVLNRSFSIIIESDLDLENFDTYPYYSQKKTITWQKVLEHKRAVIIAKAGSGKTYELKHKATELIKNGEFAFFIRLEHLKDGIKTAFENLSKDDYANFNKWKTSNKEGYFFLDSVDEAKLGDPRDFTIALKILRIEIASCLSRSTIVISSRPTFEPISEIQLFNQHLPFPQTQEIANINNEDEDPLNTVQQIDNKAVLYSLNELNINQIEHYSTEKGVHEVKKFIDAFQRSGSLNYASRPRELNRVINQWLHKKRIGSKLERIKDTVDKGIEEDDTNRDQLNPLSKEKAMEGVMIMAVACTFTSNSRIAIPDKKHHPVKAISIKDILPKWSRGEHLALLERPVFDDKAYGIVRFQDREIREYLVAEWIKNLFPHGSRREIEHLFFTTQYETEVIRPKLRAILPWVAAFDDAFREKALRISPTSLLDGGDTEQFPIHFKIKVLKAISKEIATNANRRYHSFSDTNLEGLSDKRIERTVQKLFETYQHSQEVLKILLQIVERGKLENLKNQVHTLALNKEGNTYTRIYAIRAYAVIISEDERLKFIDHFVISEEKDREIISTLLQVFPDLHPNNIIKIIKNLNEPEKYHSDTLNLSLSDIAISNHLSHLEVLFTGLSKLVFQKPYIENYYCEVSIRYEWIVKPLSVIAEELIKKRSQKMILTNGLRVLSNLARYKSNGLSYELKNNMHSFVTTWKELNNAYFWYDVDFKRKQMNEVTLELQVSFGGKFWDLSNLRFMEAVNWIEEKKEIDDKLVALSIAFRIYKENQRQPKDKQKLKSVCNGNERLEKELHQYFQPSTFSPEHKKQQQSEQHYDRIRKRSKVQKKMRSAQFRKYVTKNLDQIDHIDQSGEGKTYELQRVLFNRMCQNNQNNHRWANNDWKFLIEDQNEEVANRFRSFLINSWKYYKPQLCSETNENTNSTPNSILYGLSGLGILAEESVNWFSTLNQSEAELVCLYALHELNGVPPWLEKIYEIYPETILDTLYKEIHWELFDFQGKNAPNYVLDKVFWSCEWLFNKIAIPVFNSLNQNEVKFESSLEKCITVILSSNLVSDNDLIVTAKNKINLVETKYKYIWFSVLVAVSPEEGIEKLATTLSSLEQDDAKEFAMKFIVNLCGSRTKKTTYRKNNYFYTAKYLTQLFILMNRYIHVEEDNNRAGQGVYSPDLRDDAEDARRALFTHLISIPGKETYLSLINLSKTHPNEDSREWMYINAQNILENEANLYEWSVQDVLDFASFQECKPTCLHDLFNIAVNRVHDLKHDLEDGEHSVSKTWALETYETRLRILTANWLRTHSNNNYSIHEEEEQSDGKKPDIRFYCQGLDPSVPIEIKIADNWTGNELIERAENQLCNDYLRDFHTEFGIFLLLYRGEKKRWKVGKFLDFQNLVDHLRNHLKNHISNKPNIVDVEVIGIDLTIRSKPVRETKY